MNGLILESGGDLVLSARQPILARRAVLAGALGLAGTALVGVPRAHADPRIAGQILETYRAAGGANVLGAAVDDEVKLRIGHRDTYGQQFEQGTVWWGSDVGKVDLPALPSTRVRLDSMPNFRPAAGVWDVWRSDDPDDCTALEKRIIVDLGIETMIAMNSGKDTKIPGVKRYHYKIDSGGDKVDLYRSYVADKDQRSAVGKVLKRVAESESGVLVHCTAGKDRTGWVCDLMQRVVGLDGDERDQDYMATAEYSGKDVDLEWLNAARDELTSSYGTLTSYLTDGCGLDADDVTRLKNRLL